MIRKKPEPTTQLRLLPDNVPPYIDADPVVVAAAGSIDFSMG